MITFSDMSDFHKSYQFFMNRQSKAGDIFILIVLVILVSAFAWTFFAKMDDSIKASALLRPVSTISQIKVIVGGEVGVKSYRNDDFVNEGELLLSIDCKSDTLDLENSKNLMKRIEIEIAGIKCLLDKINKKEINILAGDTEVFIRTRAYEIEYDQISSQINELKTKLNRELALPESMLAAQRIEDIENEISQANLQLDLWENNKQIEALTDLRNFSVEEEKLERYISDLERNIKNSTVYAPISGKINEIRALNIGDYVLPGESIINIIPTDATLLKAELSIDPAYVAQVQIGQKVLLRFPGLPPSRYGTLEAEISLIPADYVISADSKPSFIIEARIDEPFLRSKTEEKIMLRPGIGAEARIILAHDKVINMILKKLDFINYKDTSKNNG